MLDANLILLTCFRYCGFFLQGGPKKRKSNNDDKQGQGHEKKKPKHYVERTKTCKNKKIQNQLKSVGNNEKNNILVNIYIYMY